MAAEDAKALAEASEEEVVVAEMPPEVAEKELPPPPAREDPTSEGDGGVAEVKVKEEKSVITQFSVSFKEESNVVSELPVPQKKALEELKRLIREALEKHEFAASLAVEEEKKMATVEEEKKEAKVVVVVVEEEEKAVVAEEPLPSPPPAAEAKEEEAVVVVAQVEAAVDDEDGAKTVEAIKETIVEVSAAPVKTEETDASPPLPEPEPAAVAPEPKAELKAAAPPEPEQVSLWGVPLLGNERSDVVLLKFLRARDFKPKEALAMIKSTVRWRKEFGVEALQEEDLGGAAAQLEEFVYMHGMGRDGHPVCYNLYGELGRRKELYKVVFADEEKRKRFLRWRVRFMERSIEKFVDFSPGGVCTFLQVNDLRNSPGLLKREVWVATNKALQLLQDNYPEFVAKQVFINVPWWYLLLSRMISPFVTQRTKSKFVFATPSKTAETLFKYIAPEQVPVKHGGLYREGGRDFTATDPVTKITISPAAKHTLEFPASEGCEVFWELRVVGWEASYGAEFVPTSDGSYIVIVSKTTMSTASDDEPIICDSFKVTEPGKLVVTIDNCSSKKKILLYRSKTRGFSS